MMSGRRRGADTHPHGESSAHVRRRRPHHPAARLARSHARGDLAAPEELLRAIGGRLEALARKMLRRHPGVGRWADTDDVLQNALHRRCSQPPLVNSK